jgi:hypothetical protein
MQIIHQTPFSPQLVSSIFFSGSIFSLEYFFY